MAADRMAQQRRGSRTGRVSRKSSSVVLALTSSGLSQDGRHITSATTVQPIFDTLGDRIVVRSDMRRVSLVTIPTAYSKAKLS
jgi:hypothetical protein